jgi:hypothetical protein
VYIFIRKILFHIINNLNILIHFSGVENFIHPFLDLKAVSIVVYNRHRE